MKTLPLALVFSFLSGSGLAHHTPTTPEEIEAQRALQVAAYHCAPAVAMYTAERKRAWARQVLGGHPKMGIQAGLEGYDELFDERGDDHASSLMSCSPLPPAPHPSAQNTSCVMTPITTEGPYYHHPSPSHIIRSNIAELQPGLLLLLDIGVIDVNTCRPLPRALVDIWHANATGHYSGHPTPAPGNEQQKPQVGGQRAGLLSPYPRTKPDETWLRGAQVTETDGVARFTTIFPGYYTGRATHVHAKVYTDWQPEGTGFSPGRLSHVGQFFFDDAINEVVDKMHPYTTNALRDRTRNWRDSLNIFEDSRGPEGEYDPVFRLEFLGGVISQGLAGFITMGINASASVADEWSG